MYAVIRKGDGRELARSEYIDIAEAMAIGIAERIWPTTSEMNPIRKEGDSYLTIIEVDVPIDEAKQIDVVLRRTNQLRWSLS